MSMSIGNQPQVSFGMRRPTARDAKIAAAELGKAGAAVGLNKLGVLDPTSAYIVSKGAGDLLGLIKAFSRLTPIPFDMGNRLAANRAVAEGVKRNPFNLFLQLGNIR